MIVHNNQNFVYSILYSFNDRLCSSLFLNIIYVIFKNFHRSLHKAL